MIIYVFFHFRSSVIKIYRFRKESFIEASLDVIGLGFVVFLLPILLFFWHLVFRGFPIFNIGWFYIVFLAIIFLYLNIFYCKIFLKKYQTYKITISPSGKEMLIIKYFIIFSFILAFLILLFFAYINGEFETLRKYRS